MSDPYFLLVYPCSSGLYRGVVVFWRKTIFCRFLLFGIPLVYGQVHLVIINEIFYLVKKNKSMLILANSQKNKGQESEEKDKPLILQITHQKR